MIVASSAASGVVSAVARFEQSAARAAASPLNDLAAETVERLQAKVAVSANVAVLRTADDMTGTLLDMLV